MLSKETIQEHIPKLRLYLCSIYWALTTVRGCSRMPGLGQRLLSAACTKHACGSWGALVSGCAPAIDLLHTHADTGFLDEIILSSRLM